jgi:hypothetical protein
MANSVPKPAPRPFATVVINTNSGPVAVPCEPINDWLAITPMFGMDADGNTNLVGGFTVTHRPTGMWLAEGPGCIECCRWSGRMLASTGIDWSALTSENSLEFSTGWSVEDTTAVAVARALEWGCDAEVCDRPSDEVPDIPAALIEHRRAAESEVVA